MSTGADEGLDENYARAGYHAAQTWGHRPGAHPHRFRPGLFRAELSPVRGRRLQDCARLRAAPPRDRARMRPSRRPDRGHLSQRRRGRRRLLPQGARTLLFCRRQPDAAFREGLTPREDELVVAKQYPSAFFGTSLAATLTSAGVDSLVITGVTTSGCVRATCVDSMSSGFITLVAREGVGDRDPRPHEANLYDMNAKYADVAPEARVAEYFRSTAHWRSSERR